MLMNTSDSASKVATTIPLARHARRSVAAAVAVIALLSACGSDDSGEPSDAAQNAQSDDGGGVEVPQGATLCSVYAGEYRSILDNPTPFGEDGWDDEAAELVELAMVLEELAPPEQAGPAEANVSYFQALANVESASEFVPDSNAFNLHLAETC